MQNCLSAKIVQLLIRKISHIAAYQAYYYPQESTSTLGNGSLIPLFFFFYDPFEPRNHFEIKYSRYYQ